MVKLKLDIDYATDAAIVGVPQLAVRYVVDGGITFTKVVGAVAAPIDVAGLATAVPPEMSADVPAADVPSSYQVVTNVNTLPPAASATVVWIYSGVYGDVALLSWKIVVAAPPAVRL